MDNHTNKVEPEQPDTKTSLKGVGGWLKFFCIVLTILVPLAFINEFIGTLIILARGKYAMLIDIVAAAETFAGLFVSIYGFVIGIKIWQGSLRGKILAQRLLKVRLGVVLVIELLALMLIGVLEPNLFTNMLVSGGEVILGELGFFIIWWLYFKKSKRVRNTYPQ